MFRSFIYKREFLKDRKRTYKLSCPSRLWAIINKDRINYRKRRKVEYETYKM